MTIIVQPGGGEVRSKERSEVLRHFDLHFDTLVSIGYVPFTGKLSFGSTCTTFASTDGEVAFREGSTKLAFGADLDADTIYIVSSSASDTQTYSIQGINAAGDFTTTTVTATGTTPAAVAGTWDHVQRVICTDGVDNVGTVYVSTKSAAGVPTTTGDQIQCVMAPGDNYAVNPELRVANNQLITINRFDFSQDVQQTATVRILANRQGRWILNFKFFVGLQDSFSQDFHSPLALQEGDRMRVLVEAGGGTGAKASFGMNGNVWDISDAQKAGVTAGALFG